jgi:Dynein heavy chain C-terminal domain
VQIRDPLGRLPCGAKDPVGTLLAQEVAAMNALLSTVTSMLAALDNVADGHAVFTDALEADFIALQQGQVRVMQPA